MYLQELLDGISCDVVGDGNPDITSLSCDTSTVKPNSIFFCLKGQKYDGHDLFVKAVGEGATALVCEKVLDTDVLQIVVKNSRAVMSQMAKKFYDNCADKMKLIAIVGTNGKTTTSFILDAILNKAGYNVGVIGTNGIYFGGAKHINEMTTPDPIQLHYWLKQMYLNKVKYVIMEASAHAIALDKLCGLHFDVAIFTNFSQDHLDFFRTMDNYAKTKRSLFTKDNVSCAVVNADDEQGQLICKQTDNCVTYSAEHTADVTAKDILLQDDKMQYEIDVFGKTGIVKSHLTGKFNVYNTMSAIACANVLGVDTDTCISAVQEVYCVSGRNETVIRSDGARIVIDFAHTPDGIENILSFLKSTTHGKLIVVFGCGGDRDKFKRPLMAQAVSKYADFAVITNDNPRYEEPKDIVQDVVGQMFCKYKVVLNRSQATECALSVATATDTVAILGKGAESYQEIKGRKFPYSDMETVLNLIKN